MGVGKSLWENLNKFHSLDLNIDKYIITKIGSIVYRQIDRQIDGYILIELY